MKAFLFPALCVTMVSPVFAQTPAEPPLVKKATADLNGDGKPDTVSIASAANNKQFTLTINGIKRTVAHEELSEDPAAFRVLKFSGDSKRRLIAVSLFGAGDYNLHYFFAFDGTAIRPAGMLGGNYTVPGNGSIYADSWFAFWNCQMKYAVAPTGALQYVPQASYYVGKTATATATFPIRVSPTRTGAVVANVAPNTRIDLLQFQPAGKVPRSYDAGYYLIKTKTGLCGWAEYKSFEKKVTDLPFAG